MSRHRALYLCEGSSDGALGEVVARLLLDRGVPVLLTVPDFGRLSTAIDKDLPSRLGAALELMKPIVPDIIIMHRDSDGAGADRRLQEMTAAIDEHEASGVLLPVVPTRMTEAWLLLDEAAIRRVAGNPRGRAALDLPALGEVERRADPKSLLSEALLEASGATGRRRQRAARLFPSQRRQLLEQLDVEGAVNRLPSWRRLREDVDRVSQALLGGVGD